VTLGKGESSSALLAEGVVSATTVEGRISFFIDLGSNVCR
jgi:hypothetical protein